MLLRSSLAARRLRRASSSFARLSAPGLVALLASCATTPPVASQPAAPGASAGAVAGAADGTSSSHTALIWVNGMGCPLCSNNVDAQLKQVRGVEDVRINLGTGLVSADLSPSAPPTEQQLASAIDRTGFTLVKIQMPGAGGSTTGGAP